MVCCSLDRASTGSWLVVKQEGLTLWGGVPLFYLPFAFSLMRAAGIQRKQTPAIVQRHQNSNI